MSSDQTVQQVPVYDKGTLAYLQDEPAWTDDDPCHDYNMGKSGPAVVVAARLKTVTIEKDRYSDSVGVDRMLIAQSEEKNC